MRYGPKTSGYIRKTNSITPLSLTVVSFAPSRSHHCLTEVERLKPEDRRVLYVAKSWGSKCAVCVLCDVEKGDLLGPGIATCHRRCNAVKGDSRGPGIATCRRRCVVVKGDLLGPGTAICRRQCDAVKEDVLGPGVAACRCRNDVVEENVLGLGFAVCRLRSNRLE